MRIRNLTPHPVTLILEGGETVELPSEGAVRVKMEQEKIDEISLPQGSLPILRERPTVVEGLPEPEEGVLLLVSRVAAAAISNREDIVVPAEYVREDSGLIVGIKAVAKV